MLHYCIRETTTDTVMLTACNYFKLTAAQVAVPMQVTLNYSLPEANQNLSVSDTYNAVKQATEDAVSNDDHGS